jgi:hypothetical protein
LISNSGYGLKKICRRETALGVRDFATDVVTCFSPAIRARSQSVKVRHRRFQNLWLDNYR